MADSSPHSRVSRTRRAIALMAWGCLICSAFFLWNARQTGLLTTSTNPISASLLAAFGAFVGVFAWMLFNPNQRRTSDSPSLFMAAAATLFPPPMIAFCLMSSDSPLRWWMALGIFLLVVIGILSHVPDEFFGVPRGRSSYIVPLPLFDRVADGILDPNASWFAFNDLSQVVSDEQRPSLAPRAYLNTDASSTRTTGAATAYSPTRPASEVDDILGTDFELGLLDDTLMDFELSEFSEPQQDTRQSFRQPAAQQHTTQRQSTQSRRSSRSPQTRRTTNRGGNSYSQNNPESLRLLAAATLGNRRTRRQLTTNRRTRHAESLRAEARRPQRDSHNVRSSSTTRPETTRSVSTQSRRNEYLQQEPQTRSTKRPQRNEQRTARTTSRTATPTPQLPPRPGQNIPNQTVRNQNSPSSPTAYVQETNQRRSDRHRQDNPQPIKQQHKRSIQSDRPKTKNKANEPHQLGTSRQEDQRSRKQTQERTKDQTTRQTRDTQAESRSSKTESKTDSKAGSSLFGIPMPFSRSAEAESPAASQGLMDSTTAEPKRRKSRYDNESTARDTGETGANRQSTLAPPVPEQRSTRTESTEPVNRTRSEDRRTSQASQPETVTVTNRSESEPETSEEHFERTRDDHGSELVEGVMKIRFDKGQKRANLHIPFSPPLPGMPEVECECVGNVPLRLKVPVKQSYGIRIEARRTDASDDLETEVGFAAVYTPE